MKRPMGKLSEIWNSVSTFRPTHFSSDTQSWGLGLGGDWSFGRLSGGHLRRLKLIILEIFARWLKKGVHLVQSTKVGLVGEVVIRKEIADVEQGDVREEAHVIP